MLKTLFLEQPVWLCVAAGIAELITIAVWQSRRTRGLACLMAFWIVFGIGVYVVATLVDTPREKVAKTWVEIRQAIRERQAEKLLSYVAEDFTTNGQDKAAMRQLTLVAFKTNGPEDVIISDGELIENDSQVDATVIARYKPAERIITKWQVTFKPGPDGQWRVSGLTCLQPRSMTLRSAVGKLP
ncbi:MAG: hypothetical protein JXL80_11425 [Planctomycetes bacterium]|nr:hypothetical protein [Planctomycetota bacterium]